MLYFEYEAHDLYSVIKAANEELFDEFVREHGLKMKTDADKALAIALYSNQITYILMDRLDINPEEV